MPPEITGRSFSTRYKIPKILSLLGNPSIFDSHKVGHTWISIQTQTSTILTAGSDRSITKRNQASIS